MKNGDDDAQAVRPIISQSDHWGADGHQLTIHMFDSLSAQLLHHFNCPYRSNEIEAIWANSISHLLGKNNEKLKKIIR